MTLTRTYVPSLAAPAPGRHRCIALAALLVVAVLAALAPAAHASGYRDFNYGTISAPTADKPQSKLWFNDGSWYGTMWNKNYVAPGGTTASGRFEIHKLTWQGSTQSWSSLGVGADTRRTSYSDAYSDNNHVWIASAVTTGSPDLDTGIKLYRYTYNAGAKTYALDSGYPLTVALGAVEAVGITRDSTGVLWMTYTLNQQVWVTHTNGNDDVWAPPYVLPAPNANNLNADDISSIVAYDGKVGVLWSNQFDTTSTEVMGFAFHVDGSDDSAASWTYDEDNSGLEIADDHINLKALPSGDPAGQLVALTKTSYNTSNGHANGPLIQLDQLRQDGTWAHYTVWTPLDDVTRATLLVDTEHRMLYAFASQPCCSGGFIYYKKTSLDNIQWSTGQGTTFIDPATDTTINNTTSTKQNLDSTTGLLVEASDDNTGYYMHNTRDLGTDSTPPVTEIDAGPQDGSTIRNDGAEFRFASNEAGVTFECNLDGGAYAACPSPYTLSGLAPGTHTLTVRAKDDAGNVDPNPAQRTWTISTAAPYWYTPSADSLVVAGGTVNRGTLGYVEIDGGTHVAETSYLKFTVSGLQGVPTQAVVRVYATNGSGASTTKGTSVYAVADNSWTETGIVDANKPALGSALQTKINTVIPDNSYVDYTVTPAVTGNGTYSFALNTNQSDKVTFDSREGVRPPQLLVTDGPDITPPDTTITSAPSGTVAFGGATITFSSTENPATFECDLDDQGFTPCSSPQHYSSLADGAHQVAVRAIDAAGNTDPSPATASWTVDTTAPAVPIITAPADGSYNNTGSVALSGTTDGGATVEVFDGSTSKGTTIAAGDGTWTKTVTAGDGSHAFTASASDALGNTSAPSAAVTVTVDTLAPSTQILSGPSGTTASRTAAFTYSSSEAGSTFQCKLDASAYSACPAAGTSYSGLSDGTHTFSVRSIDQAGNVDPAPPNRTWTVDTVAPDTTITSGPTGSVVSRSASFAFSATETPVTFECSLDGAAFAACTSPKSYSGLAAGAHTFQVRATDAVGNQDGTPATRTWTVNITAFSDAFDTATAFATWTSVKTGNGGSATVQSSIGVNGTKAAHLLTDSKPSAFADADKALSAPQADLTVSGDFKSPTESTSGVATPLLRLFDAGGTERAAVLRVNGTGRLQVRYVGTSTVTTTTTTSLALNTYGHLEIHVVARGASTSTLEVKLNGTTVLTTNSATVPVAGIGELQIGNDNKKQAFDTVIDNVLATI
jgi:hypothetical protein